MLLTPFYQINDESVYVIITWKHLAYYFFIRELVGKQKSIMKIKKGKNFTISTKRMTKITKIRQRYPTMKRFQCRNLMKKLRAKMSEKNNLEGEDDEEGEKRQAIILKYN